VSGEASDAGACLYVISWGLERAKIGVAGDARKRLREPFSALDVVGAGELTAALESLRRD